ncbi:phage portal protein [Gordonia sp. NB41Y]|uniref:phage portal protein n=1 Tax=Gordonia sp. NB41Y TaxID=875808 RepID=UPI0002BFAE2C|nr:phage portal protein [Gordonia sp. NB41Y]EMP15046.1 hypothetical protein ISGA_34 [Gordonia sp. NB41Y]WLP91329.1 phage portal protein [Gordonia sp. NB41Y]
MKYAEEWLQTGVAQLLAAQQTFDLRQANYEGEQDLPYAPEGVSAEYETLRRQAIANWLQPAMDAPVQRMEVESISDDAGKTDVEAWARWVAFDLETRQRVVFSQMMVHGRGIMSVSKAPGGAKARVENCRRVYLHPHPEDPFEVQFAVKMWVENERPQSGIWLPTTAQAALGAKYVAVVYDDVECVRFEKTGSDAVGGWQAVSAVRHGLGEIPFVEFGHNVDADGVGHTAIDQLIPMQDAINTIRFNTLLAMQFSAYRQRVATGYDPLLRNASGEVIYVKDEHGNEIVGPDGQPVPQLRPAGRIGVDRLLVFPGKDTKVFDLEESNLQNYITVYKAFLTDLFSKAQVPPQYALDRMSNLSGDALAGAEATLTSLVMDLKREANSGFRRVFRLIDSALGEEPRNRRTEWADTEPKSFAQIVDGVTKLIASDFPRRGAYDMLPGATPTKVDEWMRQSDEERESKLSALMLDQFTADLGEQPQLA